MALKENSIEELLAWESTSKDKCSNCGEEGCETIFNNKKEKIVVRDCEPIISNDLPKELSRAQTSLGLWKERLWNQKTLN